MHPTCGEDAFVLNPICMLSHLKHVQVPPQLPPLNLSTQAVYIYHLDASLGLFHTPVASLFTDNISLQVRASGGDQAATCLETFVVAPVRVDVGGDFAHGVRM